MVEGLVSMCLLLRYEYKIAKHLQFQSYRFRPWFRIPKKYPNTAWCQRNLFHKILEGCLNNVQSLSSLPNMQRRRFVSDFELPLNNHYMFEYRQDIGPKVEVLALVMK